MLPHIQDALRERLRPSFGDDSEEVLSWLIASEDRRAVIVVGAGFSKNAVWKAPKAGSAAAAIPLWSKIDETLSNDLRLQGPDAFDGLMLPDLYTADLGVPRYRHLLLGTLPDSQIDPGPAHHALFQLHRPEAVITTNQLDTLLDRGLTVPEPQSRWFAVRSDPDLAQPEAEKRVQLIYLHGHRSAPGTWVFSRSQYEDLDRSRPVMMRRVRQLFAQHPVLFVGFSLTDPNFHALVRQVDREMRHDRPHMLAIMTSAQPLPFVKHWQRYGVRIAVLNENASIPVGFQVLFNVLGSVGRDRRPAEGVLEFEEALRALLDIVALRDRVEHLGVILKSRATPGGGLRASDDSKEKALLRTLWLEVALPTGGTERDKVLKGPRFATRSEFTEASWNNLDKERQHEILEEERFPFIGGIPADRFSRRDRTARIVAYQVRSGTSLGDIVDWLRLWFDEFLDEGNEPDSSLHENVGSFCDLLSWGIATCPSLAGSQAAVDVVERCAEILRRYEDPRLKRVTDDLGKMGHREAAKSRGPTAMVRNLQEAADLALNGNYKGALSLYLEVAETAREMAYPWYEWIALAGAMGAYDAESSAARFGSPPLPGPHEEENRRADWAQRRDELSGDSVIAGWGSRMELRKQRLMSEAVNKRRMEERERLRMSRTIVMSGVDHDAWKSWRDLEENGASPWQVEPLLTWLIDANLFGSDVQEEIRLRLRYCLKDTHQWLSDLAYSGRPTNLAARRDRDLKIVGSLFGTCTGSITENVAALRGAKGINLLVQRAQVESLPEFLQKSKQRLGSSTRSFGAQHNLSADYAAGWVEYGRLLTKAEQFQRLDEYVSTIESRHECDEFVGGASGQPWSRWGAMVGKDEVLRIAFRWAAKVSTVSSHRCAATIPCVAAERVYGPKPEETLPADVRAGILEAARAAATFEGTLREYSKALAVQSAARFAQEKASFDEVLELAYPGVALSTARSADKVSDLFARGDALANILMAAIERSDSGDLAQRTFDSLAAIMQENVTSILDRTRKNPHLRFATTTLRAMADFCSRHKKPLPPDLATVCVQLVEAEPQAVSTLASILADEVWGDRWTELRALVLRFSRPSTDPDSQSHQSAIASMLREVLDHEAVARATWLAPAWAVALSNCTSEQTLLANHQAALAGSVVCSGIFPGDSVLWQLAAAGVRSAARDPRPVIRIGVANVHRDLPSGGGPHVEALRAEIAGLAAQETYAAICAIDSFE